MKKWPKSKFLKIKSKFLKMPLKCHKPHVSSSICYKDMQYWRKKKKEKIKTKRKREVEVEVGGKGNTIRKEGGGERDFNADRKEGKEGRQAGRKAGRQERT